jgi:hypothetical protein
VQTLSNFIIEPVYWNTKLPQLFLYTRNKNSDKPLLAELLLNFILKWFLVNTSFHFLFIEIYRLANRFELKEFAHIQIFKGNVCRTRARCTDYWLHFQRLKQIISMHSCLLQTLNCFCRIFPKTKILVELTKLLISFFWGFFSIKFDSDYIGMLSPNLVETTFFFINSQYFAFCKTLMSYLACHSAHIVEASIFWLFELHFTSVWSNINS